MVKALLTPFPPQLDYTPLLFACQYSKLAMVKYFTTELSSWVDVEACCKRRDGEVTNQNGLHLAAIHNDTGVAVFEQLVKAGCPLNVLDSKV